MVVSDIQAVLAATTYYRGPVTGAFNADTYKAIAAVERTQAKQYKGPVATLMWIRRGIMAVQAVLNVWGYEAGAVDGYAGHNTLEALNAWRTKATTGKRPTVRRTASKTYTPDAGSLPRQRDCARFYGTPGKNTGTVRKQLVTTKLPFSLRIDWNIDQRTNKITVHEKCAPSLKAALIEVYEHYGEKRFRELGIDRYAGGYNPRRMRNGRAWSMHAYGCAVDFFARPNGLKTKCPKALFCGPEYKAFLDIMEKHGWLPAIRLWGSDAMHFQRARM